jgi:cardiolipin synthase
VSIGRKRVARRREVISNLRELLATHAGKEQDLKAVVPDRYEPLFHLGRSINGFNPVGGNSGELLADSNAAIDRMVSDIDAAKAHVHVLFYIWLADRNGLKIAEALKRAAQRRVKCRAIADGLGSRAMIRSQHWQSMRDAGVDLAVVDGRITYCGSQNCADPEFLVKAKYAPWVDAMIRFEGPIARQNQYLFASDWMTCTTEDIHELLREPIPGQRTGFTAQVIGTGPTARESAMPEMFESLIYAARHELLVTTPYYVPNESLQNALCSAAYRGVDVTLILPARNDSRIVAGASRSNYRELLESGVKIYEYVGGLLHTKTLTIDGEFTLLGSSNIDRRSFDLNYENNILFYDSELTAAVRGRQNEYLAKSTPVSCDIVDSWSMRYRLWNNTLAALSPIL